MSLVIRLFGTPQILIDQTEVGISRRKSRAVLYYLAAQDRAVLRQTLLSMFWADLSRLTAQQTLRTTLHGLRRSLGNHILVQTDRIEFAAKVWVDALEFERRLTSVPFETENISAALQLYRGEFLEGFTLTGAQAFEDWLTVTREHYRRLAIRGWATLAAEFEAQGRFRDALRSLESALAIDRMQEDLQRDAMRLLYLAGDRPGAIRRYDDLRRLLDDEMGVPPMAETRRVYDDLINDRLEAPAALSERAGRRPSRSAAAPRLAMLSRNVNSPTQGDDFPFIGRDAQLQVLCEITDGSRLALIEGEPGVGKTRLAEEFLLRCTTENGALALVGRCRELDRALPYLPLLEALRGLVGHPRWDELHRELIRVVPPVWLNETARLLPELGKGSPGSSAAAADEVRLWEGLRIFLMALARRQPLVLLIDDLQWSDASTLGLLGYLLRHSESGLIRFVATLRPAHRNTAAAKFLQSLMREDRSRTLSLERLTAENVRVFAERLSPIGSKPFAQWLYSNSEGNAYVLTELAGYARRSGLLADGVGWVASALPDEPVVPKTIYSLIQGRLNDLSEEARRVLDGAVAQGREFEFPVVARASGLSEVAALDALDELQAAGLVKPKSGMQFRFDHPLTMEVAYQEVGELRHRHMHRRVAEALEQLYRDRSSEVAAQLAWHFSEGKSPERAARYALQAAEQAARLAAWDETIQFLELALEGLSGAAKLPALTQLGTAHGRAGHFARASEILRAAIELGESTQTRQAQVDTIRLTLAQNLMVQARFSEVVELAQQICVECDAENAIGAEMIWGSALSVEGADLQAAAEHLEAAKELWVSRRGGDPALLAQIQFELGSVAAQQGDLPQAVEYYRQSLSLVATDERDQAVERRLLSLNNLAYHLHLLGDASALQFANQGLELANEKGFIGLLPYLYSTHGEIALAAGDMDTAERDFSTGLELAERFGSEERIAGLTANLGLAAIRRGQPSQAIHHLSKSLGLAEAIGTRHLAAQIQIWLAPLLTPDQARRHLSEARRFAEGSGRKRLLDEIQRLEQEIQ